MEQKHQQRKQMQAINDEEFSDEVNKEEKLLYTVLNFSTLILG
jgi:hypothetical protein